MFIVDGNNLLCAIQQSPVGGDAVSDIGMCRIIGRYLRRIGQTGVVVYDGAGPADKSSFETIDGVEVVFAGHDTEADAVIEDKLRTSTAPRSLSVVSSDRRLRRAAGARRATAIKSESFWGEVQRQLKQAASEREPAAKQNGLSESETDRWLEFFGLD